MKLIESKTYLNLAKAFAGECQAYLRYKFIEYGARYNKMENIAQIVDKIIWDNKKRPGKFRDETRSDIGRIYMLSAKCR